jgi:nicotinamidase/pyrazinamidase
MQKPEIQGNPMTDKRPNVMIVVIDCQADFVMASGRLPVPQAEAIVLPGIDYLSTIDPAEVALALFTFDTHDAKSYMGSLENVGQPELGIPGFPLHCERDTPGWASVFNLEMVAGIVPTFTLEKGVFDMWEEESRKVTVHQWITQDLSEYSRGKDRDFFFGPRAGHTDLTYPKGQEGGHSLAGVDTVRIFGVASDFCVNWAVQGFLKRGFKVQIVERLTAGIGMDVRETAERFFPGKVEFVQ